MGLSRVAGQILGYLVQRPDSKDTAQGILEWWLLDEEIRIQMDLARDALNELVRKGYVLETKGSHLPALYHLNRTRLDEIEMLLNAEMPLQEH